MKHVDLWLTLDMERSVDQAIVRVPRLDNWRRIIVRLRVGDAPYELPPGAVASWSLDRFGEGVPLNEIAATVSTMEVESGETEQVIVLQWDAAWTQISGAFRAIIHIVGSNNVDLWTPTFQFIVTESPYDDATVRQSPQFSALTEMKAVLDAKLDDLNEVFDETTGAVARAEAAEDNAEAWAVGQRGGVDVPATDPAYHNNAKYYAEQAGEGGGGGGGTYDHSQLTNRNIANQHSIGSITGLQSALDEKQAEISDLSTIRSGAALGATALQSVPNTYRTALAQDAIDAGKADKVAVTTSDNGKFMRVVNGAWAAVSVPNAEEASF